METVKKPWQENCKVDNYKEKEAMDILLDRGSGVGDKDESLTVGP